MHAVCVRCGAPAAYSNRTAGGDEQLQVGDVESYEARCRRCFESFSGQSSTEDVTSAAARAVEAPEPESVGAEHKN